MENIFVITFLIAALASIWYLIRWIISKKERSPIFRKRFFLSILAIFTSLIIFGVISDNKTNEEAIAQGFKSAKDYEAAQKENITDSTEWAKLVARREAEQKEIAALNAAEAEKRAAEIAAVEKAEAEKREATVSARANFYQKPEQQIHFVNAVANARIAFKGAANDLAKGGIRRERMNVTCAILNNSRLVGWVGELTKLTTNSDGLGVVTVKIGEDVYLKTWNNSLSDISTNSMIDPSSKLFAKLSTLKEGNTVVFDASLFSTPNGPDCFSEASLSLAGSIRSPEFIAKFSDIRTFKE